MSIILKGIDLPKDGETTLVLAIDIDETVMQLQHHEWHYTDIEAIQIPKGVRLIDANALFKDLKEQQIPFNNDINSAINVAPTILESEE